MQTLALLYNNKNLVINHKSSAGAKHSKIDYWRMALKPTQKEEGEIFYE